MKYFIFIISIIFFTPVLADGLKSEKEIRAFSDTIMDKFVEEKFQEGFNLAKPHWPIPAIEIDGIVNQINQQWPLVDKRFGKPIDKEFIKEKRIGKSFIRFYYLHKFENHSMYWQYDFYKPHNEWKINKILFLDSLESLYE